MGRVGVKPEIENAAPWSSVTMVCSPGLMLQVGCRAAAWQGTSALFQPGPQPFRVSEVGRFCRFQRGSSRIHSSGVPEWIVTERHHNGWLLQTC